MQILKKLMFILILPLVVIVIAFFLNIFLGIGLFIAFIAYHLFRARAGIFSFIGTLRYSRGNMNDAVKWFKMAHNTGKAKPRAIISYAYVLLKSGDIVESENLLNNLINLNIQDNDRMLAKSNLALVLWKKGDLDRAVDMLKEVFENFKTTTVYGSLGYLLILKGNLNEALEFNLEAYEYNSSNAVILDNLGQACYLKGDYDRADEIYAKLIALNPTFPEAYYNYGLVLAEKGELEKALENIRNALNYNISFLSTVTKEEILSKIDEIIAKIQH